ncbi:Branched-chain amino acid ABC transporter, amino acid-binding protein (TC 3.A.1.4.1) [Klebsiella pneumoniae IS10]|nr:Branched-chain amino acid ABC transporter, amino acid-binding protein (TC 3.A.1.4.1) [Klebsiella pneumoniae IS10]
MTPGFTSLRNIRMSLKLKTMTLHVVIAGCMSMAFYARQT